MIPYNTDAPIYHMPLATGGLILLNTILFLVVPRSWVEPTGFDAQWIPQISSGESDPVDTDGEMNWDDQDWGRQEQGNAQPNSMPNLDDLRFTTEYPAHTLILQYGSGIKPWQWFTSIFMHADLFHLLFNMIALWAFGLIVEGKVGPLVFLMLYLGIGVGESAIEQTMMCFAGSGGSLGASAAIFGILGIAIVWAPSNEFDCFWMMGLRAGSIEIPVLMYGFISFALELLGIFLNRFQVSSSLLHLMGLGMGIALGFIWLTRNWVDCEGWDLINVWHGREGDHSDDRELDEEAASLVRSSLGRDRMHESQPQPLYQPTMTPAGSAASPDTSQFGDLFASLQSGASPSPSPVPPPPTQDSLEIVISLIETQDFQSAERMWARLRQQGDVELPQQQIGQLLRGLLAAKDYSAAVPVMAEHIRRFPSNRTGLQLNLAKILLHLERPQKALNVLRGVDRPSLDESALQTWQNLVAHAKRQLDDGVMELQG